MIKHYVEYLIPGAFFSEREDKAIAKPDPEVALKKAPREAFAFRFWKRNERKIARETLHGQPMYSDKMYFIDGQVMTLKDVEKKMPTAESLIANMKMNGWKKVIQCRTGNFQPFEKGDVQLFTTTKSNTKPAATTKKKRRS
jgi:hypothetical protein